MGKHQANSLKIFLLIKEFGIGIFFSEIKLFCTLPSHFHVSFSLKNPLVNVSHNLEMYVNHVRQMLIKSASRGMKI